MPATQVRDKLLSWGSDVEWATIEQAEKTARLPFVEGHVALMPDAHVGIGSTVGSVIPTKGAIMPAAVGVDIGCGMIAAETSLTSKDLGDNLDALMPLIERRVPAGVGKGREHAIADGAYRQVGRPASELTSKQESTAVSQFGTLGSGNHFVEVCLDERDVVWAVLHSGSRGIGNQLARRAIDEAKGLMKERFIKLEDPDLAYLVEGEASFKQYITDMLWAQRYAMGSREQMMHRTLQSLFEVVGSGRELRRINCHHNFTQLEQVCLTCSDIQRSGSQIRESPWADGLVSKVRDFLSGCRLGVHSCGGLLPLEEDGAPTPLPSRDDALVYMDSCFASLHEAPKSERSRFAQLARCACASPLRTDVLSNSFSSMSDQDFVRLFATETQSSTQGSSQRRAVSEDAAYRNSTTCGHTTTPLWITRKGAIKADTGDEGVIPGSMGTRSYIVKGKGTRASFNSCSHGAGRKMSRGKAKLEFSAESLTEAMKGKRWNSDRVDSLIDEHPGSYKDIDQVMADQADLVDVQHVLSQVFNYKGA